MRQLLTFSLLLVFFSAIAQKPELVVPVFHTAVVEDMEMSSDGRYLATAGGDNLMKVWDFQQGKAIKTVATEEDMEDVTFSPDGQYLAGTDKNNIYIIRLSDMKLLHQYKVPNKGLVYKISWAPDSRTYYFGYRNDDNKQREVHQRNLDGSGDRLIWSASSTSYTDGVNAVSCAPNGQYLYIQSRNDQVLLNLQNNQTTPQSENALFFLPNNLLLHRDGSRIWATQPANGSTEWSVSTRSLPYDNYYGQEAAFFVDPVGQMLSFSACAGAGKNLLASVDYRSGSLTQKSDFPAGAHYVQLAQVGSDYLLMTHKPKTLQLMNGSTREISREFGRSIMQAAFLEGQPAAANLAVSSFYNTEIKRLRFDNGQLRIKSFPTRAGNHIIRMSDDGQVIAAGSEYNKKEVNLIVGDQFHTLPLNGEKVLAMAVSGDGSKLAMAFFEKLKIYDTRSRSLLYTFDLAGEFYTYSGARVFFGPSDKVLIEYSGKTGSMNDRLVVRCYSVSGKRMLWAKQQHFQHFEFQNNNTILAVGVSPKQVDYLDAQTGSVTASKPLSELVYSPGDGSFNKNLDKLAIYDELNIELYSLRSGNNTGQLRGATADVKDISFYQDDFLFSGGSDNIIRLWDTRDMKPLAQLVLYDGSEEWVLVTPDGRFDGSPEAISAMYYVRGQEFIPLEQLYEQFYTPNLLAQLLSREVTPAPEIEIDRILPPPSIIMNYKAGSRGLVVEDDSPAQVIQATQASAVIELSANAPGGSIEEYRLFHNGKLVGSSRGLVVEDDVAVGNQRNFELQLTPGKNSFRAIAVNNQRTESAPALLEVNYNAPQQNPTDAKPQLGGITLHLVVVGINEYKNRKYNLNYAIADAEAFKTAISNGIQGITSDIKTHFVSNADADKNGIVGALTKVQSEARQQDILIFYYAGHGVVSEGVNGMKKDFYLVPHDVTQLYGADDALAQKGISATEMKTISAGIAAQKQLFILDACQSAGAVESIAMRGAAEEKAIAQLARSTGTHWLTASGSEQFATEFAQLGHGVFTYALLEGLKGRADSGDKRVTVNELKAWLESQVPELTQQYKGTPQYPASYGYGQDFPIGVLR